MRTNLKEAEPAEADELVVAQGNYDAAAENKGRAEEALAAARFRLADIEAKVRTAPRGAALDTVLRDRLIARETIEVLAQDVAEAEAVRVAANEYLSNVHAERSKLATAAAVIEHQKAIGVADANLRACHVALVEAINARADILEQAEVTNAAARGHGLALAHGVSAREILQELGARSGYWVDTTRPVAYVFQNQ
jgi:hypothetical protein